MNNFNDKVVYQIYPKSFNDTNGDGVGDLVGITQKLDYLADLGVDYLWLNPVFPSPQRDNGYDVADYTAVNPLFGTMQDLDQLIGEAADQGLGIMLDMVFNHTSTAHEWFQKALAGDEKYQDYYFFVKGSADEIPTNWESKFGGPAWEYVPSLGKWYLHLFDVTQADLNWENPAVREELKDVIRFWLNKGISGFRFDVVNLISKPAVLENDDEGDGRRFYTDGPRVHEYLKELVGDTGIEDMITVGEMSSTSLENCIRYSSPVEGELSMVFNFHHLKVDYKEGKKWELMAPNFHTLKELFAHWQEGMAAAGGNMALFWNNHDQPRVNSRFGDEGEYWQESSEMLAGMVHLMRGTPYIYQGEEIGMTNAHYKSIDEYRDVESINYYQILLDAGKSEDEALSILAARSRDNSRTPMQWTGEKGVGFSDGEPWLPIADNADRINATSQLDDPHSIHAFYKKLIALRKERPVVAEGDIHFFAADNEDVMAYRRTLGNEELIVLCNLRGRPVDAWADKTWCNYKKLMGNYDEAPSFKGAEKITLSPYEFLVLEK